IVRSTQPWTEDEFARRVRNGTFGFPPAQLSMRETGKASGSDIGIDGILCASWRGREASYVYEYKRLSTPKTIDAAVGQVQRYASQLGLRPLIVVPYLSDERLSSLEAEEISGLDLCGNGI